MVLCQEKKDTNYLLILLLVSSIARALIYFSLFPKEIQGVSPLSKLYYEALRYHLFDYLWYTTNIPPVTHILNAFIFLFFKPEIAFGKLIFLDLIFILDICAVCLLYAAACRFRIFKATSFFIALFYSFTIIPFELWRFGHHYDHHTIFFTILYIYSLTRIISQASIINAVLMSFSGALLIAQSSVNSIVVPIVSLALVFPLWPKLNFRGVVKRVGLVLSGPVIILFLISSKNYLVASSFVTSTKSGPAMMMFVRSALSYDNEKIVKLAQKVGVPEWYFHCFNNAVPPPDVTPDNPNYPGWLRLAKDFGICYPWAPSTWTNIEAQSWPFDFGPLKEYLHKIGEYKIEKLVDQDIYDMHYRKYLFAGYSPELSPRWIGVYGQVSTRIGCWLLLHEPAVYFKNIVSTHNNLYYGAGPYFFRRTLYSRKHNVSTLSKPILGEKSFYVITTVFGRLARFTYFFIPCYFILAAILFLLSKKGYYKPIAAKIRANFYTFFFLACPVILASLIFSMTADNENDRYFVQVTPYVVLLMGYFITVFIQIVRRK